MATVETASTDSTPQRSARSGNQKATPTAPVKRQRHEENSTPDTAVTMLTFITIHPEFEDWEFRYKFLVETDAIRSLLDEADKPCSYDTLSPAAKGVFFVDGEVDESYLGLLDEEMAEYALGKFMGSAWFGECTGVCVIPEGCAVSRCLTVTLV